MDAERYGTVSCEPREFDNTVEAELQSYFVQAVAARGPSPAIRSWNVFMGWAGGVARSKMSALLPSTSRSIGWRLCHSPLRP